MTAILHTTAALSADEARAITDRIRTSAEALWSLLLEAYERRAWDALGYETWQGYVEAEFAMSRSNSYRLLDQGRVIRALEEVTGSVPHAGHAVSQRDAEHLVGILPEVTADVRARVEAGEEPAAAVRAVVELKREERRVPHAGHGPEEEEAEEDFAPDLAAELEHAQAEIDRLQALVDSLSASDQGAEIARWADKFARLEGRLQAALREGSEAKKDAKYAKGVLAKIRSALRVERDSEILPALADREAA